MVFGYAFRFHWMWHNDYRGFSIIVYKDYNCEEWRTYDSLTSPSSDNNASWATTTSGFISSEGQTWAEETGE